jgi:hypothetical protein
MYDLSEFRTLKNIVKLHKERESAAACHLFCCAFSGVGEIALRTPTTMLYDGYMW